MSVADNFDQIPDAGFVRAYDSQAARRQFQVSVVLIVVLAVAAFFLGILVRFEQPIETMKPVPVKTNEVHFAGSLSKVSLLNATADEVRTDRRV
jgi:hypothetical protein